jgi:hypothetical protein
MEVGGDTAPADSPLLAGARAQLRTAKAMPVNAVLHRLCVCVCALLTGHGVRAVAQLWLACVTHLQQCWVHMVDVNGYALIRVHRQ